MQSEPLFLASSGSSGPHGKHWLFPVNRRKDFGQGACCRLKEVGERLVSMKRGRGCGQGTRT